MSKPSDARAPLRAVVTVMLLAPVLAWPVVTTTEGVASEAGSSTSLGSSSAVPAVVASPDRTAPPANAPLTAPPKVSGGYQIRCWQYGRLLFEENHVGLPDTARYALRISGTDTHGRPLYVADTQHATCLIRRAVDDRSWPR